MSEKTILVTKPFVPNRKVLDGFLDEVWNREWFTNNGPLLQRYEQELSEYLDIEHLRVVGNGTIALQIGIKALELEGEIITTPFSYVATTSSIVWEGCKPVFVDIDDSLNIDPNKIEQAINENTTAILATHCFGNACDIDAIQDIADAHGLKVIYDAAHCFGTKYNGKSILSYGDISTLSLHATKLVHSIEGGAVVSKSAALNDRVRLMRNFGHNGPEAFSGVGINGKNSEMHAAVGLTVLSDVQAILSSRLIQCQRYDELLAELPLKKPVVHAKCEPNRSYYPVIFSSEEEALKIKATLENHNIFTRRYFYPSLNQLEYVHSEDLPVSQRVSSSILCLPLYFDLTEEDQVYISELLKEAMS